MKRSRAIRLAGFVSAVGVSAALVAAASSGTGAYFQDSQPGQLTGTTGTVKLATQNTTLDFAGLMPGVDQQKTIKYAATGDSTGPEDIWIVFDTSSCAYGAFTGAKGNSYGSDCGGSGSSFTTGGLGRYGHFAVLSDQGMGFQSYNLAFNSSGTDSGTDSCNVNSNGDGGSNDSSANNLYCGVPGAIKIGSQVAPGAWHTANVTFGLTAKTGGAQGTDGQGATWANIPFKVVATQVGINPLTSN